MVKQMKILVVCQYFYPEQFKINDICYELVSKGNQVTVLTGLPNYPKGIINSEYRWFKKRHEIINGVEIVRVSLIGRGKGKIRLVLNYLSFAVDASIKALFIKKDFDIILVYQLSPITMVLPAIVLKYLTGKRLLLYCHDLWPESIASMGITNRSLIYKLLLSLSKWIYKSVDDIAISSKLFQKYFCEVLGIKYQLYYLPVYAEDLFEDIKPKEFNEQTHLVFAGNIGEMQSVETILYAAKRLKDRKDIVWHIIGDGSAGEKCRKIAEKFELNNVVFYGHRPIIEMPYFYNLADAFLLTLKDNTVISYTLPNKVQSYLSAGKPILAAVNGEARILIEEANCGYCSAAEDDESFANNIVEFIENRESHIILGENARQYYDLYFSKNTFFEKIIDFLGQDTGKEEGNV